MLIFVKESPALLGTQHKINIESKLLQRHDVESMLIQCCAPDAILSASPLKSAIEVVYMSTRI